MDVLVIYHSEISHSHLWQLTSGGFNWFDKTQTNYIVEWSNVLLRAMPWHYLVTLNFMQYNFVVLDWGHHLNQVNLAQSSPNSTKAIEKKEEEVSLLSANWLSLNWNPRRKRISFVLGPRLGFNWYTKREPISVGEGEGGRRVKQRQAECQAVQWDVFLEPWPWTRQHLRYYQTYQINWPNQLAKLIEDV